MLHQKIRGKVLCLAEHLPHCPCTKVQSKDGSEGEKSKGKFEQDGDTGPRPNTQTTLVSKPDGSQSESRIGSLSQNGYGPPGKYLYLSSKNRLPVGRRSRLVGFLDLFINIFLEVQNEKYS